MGDLVVVDACVSINLRAAELWHEVFHAAELEPVVPKPSLEEVLHVVDESGEPENVSLQALANDGLVTVVDLSAPEREAMLKLVVRLGRGESACLAVAMSRGASLATDDRAAIRDASRLKPPVRIVRTSNLLRAWEEREGISEVRMRAIAESIRGRACFRPPADDPHSEWWHSLLADGPRDALDRER